MYVYICLCACLSACAYATTQRNKLCTYVFNICVRLSLLMYMCACVFGYGVAVNQPKNNINENSLLAEN